MSIDFEGTSYHLLITGTDAGVFGPATGWANGSLAAINTPQTFEDPDSMASFVKSSGQFVQFSITTIEEPGGLNFVSRWIPSPNGPSADTLAGLNLLGAAGLDAANGEALATKLSVVLPPVAGRIRVLVAVALFSTQAGLTSEAVVDGDTYRVPLAYGYLVPPEDVDYPVGEAVTQPPRGYLYTCTKLNQLLSAIKAQLDTKLNKGDNVLQRDIVLVDGSIINVPPATEEGDIVPYGTGTN